MEIQPREDFVRPVSSTGDRQGTEIRTAAGSAAGAGEFFVSPVLRFDQRSLTVIFQIRDSQSGDVTLQFPPESAVERYRQDPAARPFITLQTQSIREASDPPETAGPTASAPVSSEPVSPASGGQPSSGPAETGTESAARVDVVV